MADREVIQLPSVAHRFDSNFIITADEFLDAMPQFSDDVNQVAINVNQLLPSIDNVNRVVDSLANINTVANEITNVANTGNNISSVVNVANDLTNINKVADSLNNIDIVVTNITAVANTGNSINDVINVSNNINSLHTYADTYLGAKDTPPTTRNNGDSLQNGDLYFDTAVSKMKVWDSNSSSWQLASSAVNGIKKAQSFTGDGSTTEFTVTGGYDNNYGEVYLNGVNITKDVDISDGAKIKFNTAPTDGDEIYGVFFGAFQVADALLTSGDSSTVGDVEFTNKNKGVILNDRSNGKKYRLAINNGNLEVEEV
jgi:hypothetical protein